MKRKISMILAMVIILATLVPVISVSAYTKCPVTTCQKNSVDKLSPYPTSYRICHDTSLSPVITCYYEEWYDGKCLDCKTKSTIYEYHLLPCTRNYHISPYRFPITLEEY